MLSFITIIYTNSEYYFNAHHYFKTTILNPSIYFNYAIILTRHNIFNSHYHPISIITIITLTHTILIFGSYYTTWTIFFTRMII